jgi:Zn-dependent protease with chaperone function
MQTAALLFGPGLPLTGQAGVLHLSQDQLAVQLATADTTVDGAQPLAQTEPEELALRQIGFGKPGLELSWNDREGQRWLAHVLDAAAAVALLQHPVLAALPAARALQQGTRRQSRGRAVAWSVLGLLLASPLLLLLLFFLNADRIADWAVQRIPIGQEMEFGRAAFEGMQGELRLVEDGPALQTVRDLGARLSQGSAYRFEFHLVDDPTPNAFALPGGIIVVHSGLVKATRRPEELAGVLAHEIEHVEQRHGLAALAKDMGWRLTWTLFAGDWAGGLASEAALQLGSLKFSRDAEREADHGGLQRLADKRIDPSGMADFFATLQANGNEAGPPGGSFLSTHPVSAERERDMRGALQRLPQQVYEPLSAANAWPPTP